MLRIDAEPVCRLFLAPARLALLQLLRAEEVLKPAAVRLQAGFRAVLAKGERERLLAEAAAAKLAASLNQPEQSDLR